MWVNGMKDSQGNTTDNHLIYGSDPSQSFAINQFWKTKSRKEITMAPGATFKRRWVENMNRMVSNAFLDTEITNGELYLGGITQQLVFIIRGAPGTGATAGTVNTNPVRVDFVRVPQYKYKYVADNDFNLIYASGAGMDAVGGAVTGVNITGAAVQSVTEAII